MRIALSLVSALALASPALSAPYAFTPITTPAGAFTATALNDMGQFVGSLHHERPEDAPGESSVLAFFDRGAVVPLEPPYYTGGYYAYWAYGLNDAGLVVGDQGHRFSQVFAYQDGREIALPVPIGLRAAAYDANNFGQIVGEYEAFPGGDPHGFLVNRGVLADIDVPGGTNTIARGINDAGSIVGSYGDLSDPGGFGAGFLLSGGTFTRIDVPDSIRTEPVAINDAGQIVGTYVAERGGTRGFVLSGGVYSDITGPDGRDFLPVGLNNFGQIAGRFEGVWDGYGDGQSYLGTPLLESKPVPEPATAALLTAGLAALGGIRRRGGRGR